MRHLTAKEKFIECNSRQSNSPNKDMHTEYLFIFKALSEVDYWSTDIINGTYRGDFDHNLWKL